MNDSPLVIIGRRKVDRGLGFHYCPRTNDKVTFEGSEGVLITQDREGLIWTDMILGKIDDKNIATQKAGRLAGIIGNSPQYTGSIHYWTDQHTEGLIRRHNTIVDTANKCSGCSVLQAVKYAEDTTPRQKINHRVDTNTFLVYTNEDTVRQVCHRLNYNFQPGAPEEDGFYHTSLNKVSTKVKLLEAIEAVPGGYTTRKKEKAGEDVSQLSQKYIKIKTGDKKGGVGIVSRKLENGNYIVIIKGQEYEMKREDFSLIAYRTFLPCYKSLDDVSSLHYVIIIRPGDENKLEEMRQLYPAINVPNEGEF